MSLYEKNLNNIKKISGELYDIITSEPMFNIKLEKISDKPNYIAEYNGAKCFLHSIYSIEEELDMQFSKVDKDADAIILFGIGSGEAVNYIIKNFKKLDRLVIVEPSLQIFNEFLKNKDIVELFKKVKNLSLIVNQNEDMVTQFLYNHILNYKNIHYTSSISYKTLFLSYHDSIVENVKKEIRLKIGNIKVAEDLWKEWLVNSIRNIKQECIPIEYINHIFKGKSVVIISAGPSLNKNMHLINKIKEKAIIIAVGTAIKILDSNGIKPHFRAAFDGSKEEMRIFKELDDYTIPIIYGSKLYHEILPNYKGLKFSMVLMNDYFNKAFYNSFNFNSLKIYTGASIANVILNLVCESKCSQVIFMGQDLCYTKEEMYAKGAAAGNIIINERDTVLTKDIYKNDVYTHRGFLNMKYGLEHSVEYYKNIKFINASEGGLNIEGAENKKLETVINDNSIENIDFNIDKIMYKVNKEFNLNEFRQKLDFYIDKSETENNKIINVNKKRIEWLVKLRKNINKNLATNRLANDFNYIQGFEKELIKNNYYYREVVAKDLKETLDTLMLSLGYNGEDTRKQVEAAEKVVTGICLKVQEHVRYSKELMQEYKK